MRVVGTKAFILLDVFFGLILSLGLVLFCSYFGQFACGFFEKSRIVRDFITSYYQNRFSETYDSQQSTVTILIKQPNNYHDVTLAPVQGTISTMHATKLPIHFLYLRFDEDTE